MVGQRMFALQCFHVLISTLSFEGDEQITNYKIIAHRKNIELTYIAELLYLSFEGDGQFIADRKKY